jgi:hypothetical protein
MHCDRSGRYITAQREPKAGEQQRPISATRVLNATLSIFCKSAGLSHAAVRRDEDFPDKAVHSRPQLPAQSHHSDSVLLQPFSNLKLPPAVSAFPKVQINPHPEKLPYQLCYPDALSRILHYLLAAHSLFS